MEPIYSLKNITKEFPGVLALDDVSVDFYPGEVHAICGENGAGKSTLMKVCSGMYMPDGGALYIKGKKAHLRSIADGLKNGISMVHQELSPVPYMTVAENIYLGHEPTLGAVPIVSKIQLIHKTRDLFEEMKIEGINPKSMMYELSVAETQLVEIAKVMMLNSDMVIMDEPTSAITDREAELLFDMIEDLKRRGIAIAYISHKMDEIFRISDKITVMRDGKHVGTHLAADTNTHDVITMMVGRELTDIYPKLETQAGGVAMQVERLSKEGLFEDITFNVRRGEILGIAGLMGAGRTEVVETVFGLRKADSGKVVIDGKPAVIKSPRDAIKKGLALVTEDRKGTGLVLTGSIKENVTLAALDKYKKFGFIKKRSEIKATDGQIESLRIKTPSRNQLVANLSGGNQQKVVLAKWMLADADIIIFDEPTRGIDVGAKAEIHSLMSQLAADGKAVVMISSEMPEVLGMSDRIIVLCEGRVTGEIGKEEFSQKTIMEYAAGIRTANTEGGSIVQ